MTEGEPDLNPIWACVCLCFLRACVPCALLSSPLLLLVLVV